MVNLTDLGFSKNVIIETIVATYNSEGYPNAAPIGAKMTDEQHLAIKPYNSSSTLKNIKAGLCATVNLTSDVDLFYKTAFKEANPSGITPQEWFEKAESIDAPRLRSADAVIGITVKEISPLDAKRTSVVCKVSFIEAKSSLPKGYCRAFPATIEAIIHATRIKALANEKSSEEHLNKLVELINNCDETVNRTAPNSRYSEIMTEIKSKIGLWRAQK